MGKVNILLPIAGNGKRFSDVGYDLPKPLIPIKGEGKTILQKSMEPVNFEDANLIFIVRQEHINDFALDSFLKETFGQEVNIVPVEYETEGAVCSCLLAEELIDNEEPLVIFTPDCYFEPQFDVKAVDSIYDGVVAVFNSNSDAHSYVVLDEQGFVTSAAEKEVISNDAVGGMYYYKKGSDFVKYANQMIEENRKVKGEFYICPVYNFFIKDGKKIGIDRNSKHIILGTPGDLERYVSNMGRINHEE